MSRLLLTSLIISIGLLACKDKELPPVPEVRYEGAVYIGCDIGPYQLNIDSLITHCTGEIDRDQPADSIQTACIYDELSPVLSASFDVEMVRGNYLNQMELGSVNGDPEISEIPLVLGGQEYAWNEYPYYSGYELKWADRTLRLQALNKWVGGCFHDLILWEVIIR